MLACGMHRRVSPFYSTPRLVHHLSFSGSDFFPALLPSSFAMYTTMLALSHAFIPPSNKDSQRTLATVMYFTIGAVLGWPFALAIAIPFVVEELFVFGADQVTAKEKLDWQLNRGIRLLICGALAAIIPVSMMSCPRLAFTERCADTRSRNRFILLWQANCSVLEHCEVQRFPRPLPWPRSVWHGTMVLLPSEPITQLQHSSPHGPVISPSLGDNF
jgi:Alg9-like mannosyltransferase family